MSSLGTLTDGKGQTTTWAYDAYSRLTKKVDALGTTNLTCQFDPYPRGSRQKVDFLFILC